MDPYKFLCILMDSSWSLWLHRVLIGPYASLWILMGSYGSLCVYMESNGFLWVFIGPYGFS